METSRYETLMYDVENNITHNHTFLLTEDDVRQPEPISKSRNHKTLKNNMRYTTSIRRLSKSLFYFPFDPSYNFSCDIANETSVNCVFGNAASEFRKVKSPLNVGLAFLGMGQNDEEARQLFSVQYIDNKYSNITCNQNNSFSNKRVSVIIPLTLNDTNIKELDLSSCSTRCIATAPRKQICSNPKVTVELDMTVTFWSYLFVRVFVGIVSGTSFAMFEGAVIAILREHKADYGLQRIYATIGGMISSPISGWMIDFASKGKGYTDFR